MQGKKRLSAIDDKLKGTRAPKKILFTSTKDNQKVSTSVRETARLWTAKDRH